MNSYRVVFLTVQMSHGLFLDIRWEAVDFLGSGKTTFHGSFLLGIAEHSFDATTCDSNSAPSLSLKLTARSFKVKVVDCWEPLFHQGLSYKSSLSTFFWFLMSKSMCGCGCSIISSLMKRLGRSACCSDLLSCSHTSEHLQRLATGCPPQHKVTSSWNQNL